MMRGGTFFISPDAAGAQAGDGRLCGGRRCNKENMIERLKNEDNAMRMPVDDLLSDWAYMVMTCLAWNGKAWFGLLLPDARGSAGELIGREFHPVKPAIILYAARLERTDRRDVYWHHELYDRD